MTEVKQYTPEEFQAHLIEFYGSDFPGLADLLAKMPNWIAYGKDVAEYVNAELNPNSYYDRRFIGVPRDVEPQRLIGDSQGSSRMYQLHGIYREHPLNLVDVLKLVKIERPAVVHVDCGNKQGDARGAWVIYRDKQLYRVIIDDGMNEHLWQDYGYPEGKEWSSGTLSITGEEWDRLWDKSEWPVSDFRYPSFLIEELHKAAMQGFSDDSAGDGDHAAYRFDEDLTILHADVWANFSTEEFKDAGAMNKRWNELVEHYYPDDEEN